MALEQVLRGLCAMPVDEDTVRFDAASVRITPIRRDDRYGGLRARLTGSLDRARLAIALDVGFGDAVTPGPVDLRFPALLGEPEPRLLAYPAETVVAEKLEAIVSLGTRNTRMKDYHDLYELARGRAFDGTVLASAIGNTFTRRRTLLPGGTPAGLGPPLAGDERSVRLWEAFASAADLSGGVPPFGTVCEGLIEFLVRPMVAARERRVFDARWRPGGPWSDASDSGPGRREQHDGEAEG